MYAVTGDERDVYIVGEQGLVLQLSSDRQRFDALPLDYKGSLFGAVITGPGKLLVHGLRGNVRFSDDRGARWQTILSDDPSAITAGAAMQGGKAVLVSQSGRVLLFDPRQSKLRPLSVARPMPWSAIASAGTHGLVLAGFQGAQFAAAGASELR